MGLESAIFAAKSLSSKILRVSYCFQRRLREFGVGEGGYPPLFFWLIERVHLPVSRFWVEQRFSAAKTGG